MIEIINATEKDIDDLMSIRLEMLRIVNGMKEKDTFSETLIQCSRAYFLNGDQTTVLAKDKGKTVGCASISYISVMPTFDHPTGKRAHLMNVYTKKEYRRLGIAKKMADLLIQEAKKRGCTEISLDSTSLGRPLYKALGFEENTAAMVYELRKN